MARDSAVAVSAPGKVLLAGGYLCLDRAYTGLVFGLDARIHCIVQNVSTASGVTLSEITVRSPQFEDAVWEYGYTLVERDGGMQMRPLRIDADLTLNRNLFVETTLTYALSYIIATLPTSQPLISAATITILADTSYYTAPSSLPSTRFHNFATPLSRTPKTGLGSSAALVTSLTAALLSHYLPRETLDLETVHGKQRLHNLAQAAHSAAQGKVGSGFDIASAVFGSCLYRRFSPSILTSNLEPGSPGFASQLRDTVDGEWDTEVLKDAVSVPRGLRLVMCDVSCGSQTPGMVKQVLAWRTREPEEAETVWRDLHAANVALAKAMRENADRGVLRKCFRAIRRLIRLMGERSGVPIEPEAQTKLLDACEGVEGVVGGTVPGAGGWDAVVLLIEEREGVVGRLEELFSGWQGDGEVRVLGVREEMEGVRREGLGGYGSWVDF